MKEKILKALLGGLVGRTVIDFLKNVISDTNDKGIDKIVNALKNTNAGKLGNAGYNIYKNLSNKVLDNQTAQLNDSSTKPAARLKAVINTPSIPNYGDLAKSYGLNTSDEIKKVLEELIKYPQANILATGIWDLQSDEAYTNWLKGINLRVSTTKPMEGILFKLSETKPKSDYTPFSTPTAYLITSNKPIDWKSNKLDINNWVKGLSWGKYITISKNGGIFKMLSGYKFYTPQYLQRVAGLNLKSRDDVKAYQKKLGVKDDGVWGKDTEHAYISSLNLRRPPLKLSGRAPIDWNTLEQNPQFLSEEGTKMLLTGIRNADIKLNARDKARVKAFNKSNRNIKAPFINNTAKLLEQLYNLGMYNQGRTFELEVDGTLGNRTRQAIERAKAAGYYIDEATGYVGKTPYDHGGRSVGYGDSNLGNGYSLNYSSNLTKLISNENIDNGHAIYLHYPNFIGNSKNAFKIGNFDPGEVIGNPQLSVGHAATILVDNDGNANYYEYGRYATPDNKIIGKERRSTVKGGNWRRIQLPKLKSDENDSVYVARILNLLPDTKTGTYLAMSIPSVDVKKAQEYIYSEADNPNRKEYGIFNTCATGACNAVLPFRINKLNNRKNRSNREGYSEDALKWSRIPFTTDSYAKKARTAASNVYIMNK